MQLKSSPAFTSNILPIRLQAFKTMVHWYMTPNKLSLITPSISIKRWWNCGDISTYVHCWLNCPSIYPFWQKVFRCITEILEVQLDIDPQLVIVNRLEDEIIYRPEGTTLSVLLSVARLTVVQLWKEPKTPSITIWYSKLWTYKK